MEQEIIRHNFILIEENNFTLFQELLYKWFQMPHVVQWWPTPEEQEDFFNSFLKRIRSGTKPYLVLYNDISIGYIQTYSVDLAQNAWLPKLSGNIIGIDQFIGEPDYLYKGIGTLFIKEFIKTIIAKESITKIIVDPEPINFAAIRCYEKVGFKKVGEFKAPWGPALLMVYKL